jgi:anaerobic magnesium-protoporphyrin IX monomethyl ester cyclase
MAGKTKVFMALVGPPPKEILYVTPPLGLMYIAAWIRERFDVEILLVNQRVEKWSSERLAKEAAAFKADIVALGCMTPSAYALPEVTQGIRTLLPEALIVLGGPHVAAFREEALAATSANLAVAGEGEIAMERILQAYLDAGDMTQIPALMRREEDGSVVTNPGTLPIIEDLDSMPMPAYDLIDHRKYRWCYSMTAVPYRNYVSLFSSRGCPYGCLYCHNVFGRKFRAHSAERIVEEIRHYKKTYHIDEIEFVDDCFNLDKKRVMAYTELLLKEIGPIKTTFPNAIRGDIIDEDTAQALAQSGLYYSALSMESGSPRIQKLIGKNLDIEKFLKGVELFAKNGVFTVGYNMLGFPSETAEEMEQTIRIATDSYLHLASFFRMTPFPGTKMLEYAKEHCPEKLKPLKFEEMEYSLINANVSAVPDDIFDRYVRDAYHKFYLRPNRIYRILRDYPGRLRLIPYSFMISKRVWNRFT